MERGVVKERMCRQDGDEVGGGRSFGLAPAHRELVLGCDCAELGEQRQACAVEAEKDFAGSTCNAESVPQSLNRFWGRQQPGCRPSEESMLFN